MFKEKNIYPKLTDNNETKERFLKTIEEHAVAKHLFSDVGSSRVLDDRWKAKMTVLSENVQRHVRADKQKKDFSMISGNY